MPMGKLYPQLWLDSDGVVTMLALHKVWNGDPPVRCCPNTYILCSLHVYQSLSYLFSELYDVNCEQDVYLTLGLLVHEARYK